MTLLDAALRALDRGWNVIPVHAKKAPHAVLIQTGHWQIGRYGQQVAAWRGFQQERVTPDLIKEWFHPRWRVPGLAAVTGKISDLVVLDFDGEDGQRLCRSWNLTPNTLSGSGSPHLHFRHPGWRVANAASGSLTHPPFPGLDVRGDGGLIVLPPSKLNNGLYRLLRHELHDVAELPPLAASWTGLSREIGPTLPEVSPVMIPTDTDFDVAGALADATARATGGRDNAGYQLARTLQSAGLTEQEATEIMRQYARSVPQHDSRGRYDPYTERDAMRNLKSAYSAAVQYRRRTQPQTGLEERVRRCLPLLTLPEREEVSRLLAATILRDGQEPEKTLLALGLNTNVVQVIRADMAAATSVRGRASLERWLKTKGV